MTGRWAKEVLEYGLSRRSFLKAAGTAAAAATMGTLGCVSASEPGPTLSAAASFAPAPGRMIVATDADPVKLVDRALDAFGGLPVKSGDKVVVKANFTFAKPADLGACNHPQVLTRLMERCKAAGASEVVVFDHTIDNAKLCLERSGIKAAVEKAGFSAVALGPGDYADRAIGGTALKSTRLAKLLNSADVFINAPVIKSHGSTRLTASMKNLMGAVEDRQAFHSSDLDACIADLAYVVRPTLIVADAYRVMKANGPAGGSADDVVQPHQLIVGGDPVAVDSYAATLLGLTGADIAHIMKAYQKGLGEYDLSKVPMEKVV